MRKKIEPGEWEVDEHGRHFRRVGDMIEYMPELVTAYGTFEAGFVPPLVNKTEEPPKKPVLCPLNSRCSEQCARYTESGCGLVTGEGPTPGRRCPFGNKVNPTTCKDACAFWELCNNRKENN